MKNEKHILFLLLASAGLVLILTGFSVLSKKKQTKGNVPAVLTKSPTKLPTKANGEERTALFLVKSVDTEKQMISLHGYKPEEDVTLSYEDGTNFFDKYGTISSAYSFSTGDLVTALFDRENHLIKLTRSSTHFELHGVEEFSISESAIKVNKVNYRLTEQTVAYDENGFTELSNVKETDRINLTGREDEILSIEVIKGHGTIKLIHCEEYQGAKVTVGTQSTTLSGEPEFTVREGAVNVTVSGEKDAITVKVTVAKDEQKVIDLYEYGGKPLQTAQVRFHISPFATELLIDGEKQDYFEKELTLSYGEHRITAEQGGYVPYKGTVTIYKAYQSFSIDLVEKTPQVPEEPTKTPQVPEEPTKTPEPTVPVHQEELDEPETDGTLRDLTGIGAAMGFSCDTEHCTYILMPAGAKVKIDDVSIGTAPLKLEKIIGSYRITISTTEKEKTIEVTGSENGQNDIFRFELD